MGVSLGWLAAALAASGPGTAPQESRPEITYTFRTVEVRGLGWRDAGLLKPAAQHNAVSVWTAPEDLLDRLPPEARATADAPAQVKGVSQTPVHLTSRKTQDFVTRVVWKGKGKAPRPIVESVREGVTATVVGRKLDQGVLTQLVIDDVDVRSVHTMASPAIKQASFEGQPAPCPFMALRAAEKESSVTVTVTASMEADPKSKDDGDARVEWSPSKPGSTHDACKGKAECCQTQAAGAKIDAAAARAGWTAAGEGKIQIPEIGRASAAGEWLIPDGEVLVIGFGPHTVADADGKAVVREHLAIIAAEVGDEETAVERTSEDASRTPEASSAKPERPEVPRTAASLPELPGRTLPQPVHPDGTPAPLPTLPEEAADAAPSDESAEPFASPQSRRKSSAPAEPSAPKPEAKKTDGKATKSSFTIPAIKKLQELEPVSGLVAATFLATPFRRAEFLVPLKPLDLKLPFNQKLEFELVGRVVNDPASAGQVFAGN